MALGDFIIVSGCLLVLVLFLILILWYGTVITYCNYCVSKESNKIQWECKETFQSQVLYEKGEITYHICDLYYYTIPSELSKFIRIFGKNEGIVAFEGMRFYNEQEFKNFVSKFETIGDIKKYLKKEQRIIWTHP